MALHRQYPDIPLSVESLDLADHVDGRYGQLWMYEEGCATYDFLVERLPNGRGRNFIEIGSANGASFAIWATLFDGLKISIDSADGCWAGDPDERTAKWKEDFSDVISIVGSSADPEILEKCRTALNGELVDWLLIDGDHTYDAAKKDYEWYKEFVRPGGFIAFHDAMWDNGQSYDVAKLWKEIWDTRPDLDKWETRWHHVGMGILQVL
jgi:cephalosporin hydroxylase